MTAAAVLPQSLRTAPEPPGEPFIHHLRLYRNKPLEFLGRCVLEYGDVVRLRFPGTIGHLISSPEGARHVLQDNARAYDKQLPGAEKIRSLLGTGLLTSEGDFWLRQRRLMQPAFHRQRLAGFAALMVRDADEMATQWERLARVGKPVDVAAEMMRLTLRVVGETLLSKDLTADASLVGRALPVVNHHVSDRFTRLVDPPEWLPIPSTRRYHRARADLDAVVMGVIEERRHSGHDAGDLLSMVLAARDEETGEGMTDRQIRDEVLTIMLAGHETTANTLAWTFYLLDRNLEVSQRLTAEVRAVLGDRLPTLEDLPRLEYVRMVVDESMRLFPPGWLIARHALEDDEIGGYHIPAGSVVLVPPWTVQRNPRVWENPEAFDPERFRKDKLASIQRYAHFPFGGGPRFCIGSNFALMEAQLLLATLAQKFRPRLVPGTKVRLDPQITLRPAGGLPMTIHRA